MKLVAQHLSKSYGEQLVVDDVSFDVRPGEILGILGPNGAGKSTVVGMCYGSVKPTGGDVWVGSHHIQHEGRTARRHIGVVPQEGDLDRDFTVYDNISVFCGLYGMSLADARRRTDELLREFGLLDHSSKVPDQLSGGLRRRASLVRALVARPSILFLDEPTTGLDPDARQDFWRLISQLRREGCGILLTTHYMDEAERLCDRVLLMQRGRNVREGSPSELIHALVGNELFEVEGVSEDALKSRLSAFSTQIRKFGVGFTIGFEHSDRQAIADTLAIMDSKRVTQRRANLEDVFLSLTGEALT